jgi:hypothetical protein
MFVYFVPAGFPDHQSDILQLWMLQLFLLLALNIHSSLQSFHAGFIVSIRAIFLALSQPLICFSHSHATWIDDCRPWH